MAGEIPDLLAEVRTGTGKGAARQARREHKVPGVVYGGGSDPLAVNFNYHYLIKMLKAGRFVSTLFNLKVEGQEDVRVICRGIQRHVVNGLPEHVDLMRLRRTSRINLFIPVEFINHEQCVGLKRGGMLSVVRPEVELNVLAGDIPEKLVFDLAGLQIGDTITISAIKLPEGTKPTIDRDFVIANISAPRALVASDNEDGEEEDATAEE
ncbi:50S ribosomal protein L25/general stress protein Ctc [Roseinatronobacter sp. S2]|uniref:50S ribosomal protein L25/general stress protein Ctc n=1 Tax=Roseinatronobacter sp. S2 TaxID=3035471 RepID=UPI0024106D85|nr:50S ribosomal protein L25/general stress protein Ctc [Roseinatronobacter sp. S2]WFE73214.1 50S ribosomal protein L25/general stress protein Ctc [Roseinatronobacter sp. S2]